MSKLGQIDESIGLYNEVIAFQRTQYDDLDPKRCQPLIDAALEFIKVGRGKEAEPLLRESLRIREQKEPDSWGRFNVQCMLGQSLSMQERYDEAEPLLVSGYEGDASRIETIPVPCGQTKVLETIDRLIEHYAATNQPGKIGKYTAERTKYQVPSAGQTSQKP